MRSKLLFLAALLLTLPLQAAKPRRYKMKDIDKRETKITKIDKFLQTAGTVGLIYFWPGLKLQIKSNNANIQINAK